MGAMASQITSRTIVCSTIYSGADQRKHQSSASLVFVREIHLWPVNSSHKWPVTRKMFPFDDVIIQQLTANSFILISARCNLWKFYLRMFHHSKPVFSMGPALSSLAAPRAVLIDGLRWRRGRQGWFRGGSRLSVYGHLFKCLIMF